MNRRPESLDAAERALAGLLARDALPGPSPQIDARILAAARAATRPPSRHPRRRWFAGIGIAASLVLAVGIAWRLRPLPPQRPAASEAPVAGRVAERMDRVSAAAPAAADAVVSQPRPPAPELPKAVPLERESAARRKQAAPEPPIVFDAPSPMDKQAPPPAPPPPPAPVAAPAPVANAMAAPAGSTMQAAKAQAPAARAASASTEAFEPASPKQDARTLDRLEVTGSRIRDSAAQADNRSASGLDAAAAADAAAEEGVSRAVLDEEPPATADSPQVRDAWLQRIRDLLSAGETDAARNSLAEFRRRYPKYVLPEDLRRIAAP
ncbi:MAG TPA: hypothetical protein VFI26_09575 [Lysobacter sp.]|nr:hypothetical protein [Lysobacter sp.]